ncbi:MAG: hypothetical protein KZQ94_20780 [Candidatus Thiodiazotropha sp. (ex Troendleina suluensis)]|nr:hypothetical protein [Candidatus Thiodiazotropha sp. (ex Troendleina suluensis)]
MRLRKKTTLFLLFLALSMVTIIVVGGLLSFRYLLLSAAEQQAYTAAEIVRVHLTSSMVNGTIDQRQSFLDSRP